MCLNAFGCQEVEKNENAMPISIIQTRLARSASMPTRRLPRGLNRNTANTREAASVAAIPARAPNRAAVPSRTRLKIRGTNTSHRRPAAIRLMPSAATVDVSAPISRSPQRSLRRFQSCLAIRAGNFIPIKIGCQKPGMLRENSRAEPRLRSAIPVQLLSIFLVVTHLID